jgi:predicted TIM-barrel fold metal-dependent hydrolase
MSGIIDLHVHYYTEKYVSAILSADTISTYKRQDGRLVAKWRSGVSLTVVDPHPGPSERIEMMDHLGVAKQVLSVPSPNAYFLEDEPAEVLARQTNEEFADIVRSNPRRFEALAMLPLRNVDQSLDVLDWALNDLEMKGTMILSNINGMPLDDPSLEPFWDAANDLNLLVYVHPTVPDAPHHDENALAIAVGFFSESTLTVARLAYSGIFERYPNIRWVFSHLGGTLPIILPRLDSYWRQFEDCRERAPKPPSEYAQDLVFDTATKHQPAIRCAIETYGQDRLVFGSDYPHVPGGTGPYIEALEPLEFKDGQYAAIMSARAETLLAGGRI